MNNPNNPVTKENLSKASIVGVSMAIGGIILFLVLYAVLTNAGADMVTRVVIALCIPPAIMAALIGGYFLIVRPRVAKSVASSEFPFPDESTDEPAT